MPDTAITFQIVIIQQRVNIEMTFNINSSSAEGHYIGTVTETEILRSTQWDAGAVYVMHSSAKS